MNFSWVDLPKRPRLENETRELYVQFDLSETRRVEIVVPPRLTCTDTRPLQPAARVMPLGSVSRPLVRKTNGARRSRPGVTVALRLPLRRAGAAVASVGGGGGDGVTAVAAGAGGGGGGGDVVSVTAGATPNVAVTERASVIAMTHVVELPEQPPPVKPVKSEPADGLAASVTIAPWL